jgi:acyl carrier protein
MAADDHIYVVLTGIFRDVFDDDRIVLTPTMSAADLAAWDSLNHLNLIAASEIRFGIKFSATEIAVLRDVGDFVRLIRSRAEATHR